MLFVLCNVINYVIILIINVKLRWKFIWSDGMCCSCSWSCWLKNLPDLQLHMGSCQNKKSTVTSYQIIKQGEQI